MIKRILDKEFDDVLVSTDFVGNFSTCFLSLSSFPLVADFMADLLDLFHRAELFPVRLGIFSFCAAQLVFEPRIDEFWTSSNDCILEICVIENR